MEKTQKTFKFYGPLIGAALGVVLTFGFAIWDRYQKSFSANTRIELFVVVVDASRGAPLEGAVVQVFAKEITFVGVTDSTGLLRIILRLPPSFEGHDIQILLLRCLKDGYQGVDLRVPVESVRSQRAPIQVLMEPLRATQDRYSHTFHSGPVPSGSGNNFSQWYRVVADRPKPGYEIDLKKSFYSLSGDRQCNAWSECSWVIRTPETLVFQFRLQGHNEWPAPGQALSDGTLYVEYKQKQ